MDTPQGPSQPPAFPEACAVSRQLVRGATVVAAVGTVDAVTAPRLEKVLNEALQQAPSVLIADLTEVEFLASAGMSVLVSIHEQLESSGRFAIVADGPGTSRPLQLVGIGEVIALYRNLDDALAALTA